MGTLAGGEARPGGRALEASIHQRLAEIEQRLVELRQARPQGPDRVAGAKLLSQARRRAVDAERHWREAAFHIRLVRQLMVQAFRNAARAHEHAAEASERFVRAGIGDVAEARRRAAFHRSAAEADRQQAQLMGNQALEPEPPAARAALSRGDAA